MKSDKQPTKKGSRARNIVLWVLQGVVAFFFINAGIQKMIGNAEMVEMFRMIGAGQWLRYVVGTLEIAGAIGILIPRLSGLAAMGISLLMVGAMITNVVFLNTSAVVAFVPFVLASLVAWGRWEKTKDLLASIKH